MYNLLEASLDSNETYAYSGAYAYMHAHTTYMNQPKSEPTKKDESEKRAVRSCIFKYDDNGGGRR